MSERVEVEEGTPQRLRDALVYSSLRPKLFEPLQYFFRNLRIHWSDVPTAVAVKQQERRWIEIGRKFWVDEVMPRGAKFDIDPVVFGVHFTWHELLHHLLRHLDDAEKLEALGYSDDVQGFATDCYINATLARMGFGGFFEAFYEEKPPYAFLRPNVKIFDTYHSVGDEQVAAFYGVNTEVDADLRARFGRDSDFYRRAQAGRITLMEALDFFKNAAFPMPPGPKRFIGSHGSQKNGSKKSHDPAGSGGNNQPSQSGGSENGAQSDEQIGAGKGDGMGNFFDRDEARRALQAVGLLDPEAANNFEAIASQVTESALEPGETRAGVEVLHKLPARFGRNDLVNIVLRRRHFEHDLYQRKHVTLLIDMSGSMNAYIPFIVLLMRKMSACDLEFTVIVWADRTAKVSYENFVKGDLPKTDIGFGTEGESVAKYLTENRVQQAVIITDNQLCDTIVTRINTQLHVCLVEGGKDEGGFLDRKIASDSRAYKLKLKKD